MLLLGKLTAGTKFRFTLYSPTPTLLPVGLTYILKRFRTGILWRYSKPVEVDEWIENVFNCILNDSKIHYHQDVTNPRHSVIFWPPNPKAPAHLLAFCIQDHASVDRSTISWKLGIRDPQPWRHEWDVTEVDACQLKLPALQAGS